MVYLIAMHPANSWFFVKLKKNLNTCLFLHFKINAHVGRTSSLVFIPLSSAGAARVNKLKVPWSCFKKECLCVFQPQAEVCIVILCWQVVLWVVTAKRTSTCGSHERAGLPGRLTNGLSALTPSLWRICSGRPLKPQWVNWKIVT